MHHGGNVQRDHWSFVLSLLVVLILIPLSATVASSLSPPAASCSSSSSCQQDDTSATVGNSEEDTSSVCRDALVHSNQSHNHQQYPSDDNPTANSVTSGVTADSVASTTSAHSAARPLLSPSCQLALAESSLPNAGWGIYTLIPRFRGEALPMPGGGDSVLQVVDLNETTALGMRLLLHDYAWDAHETGGMYEALRVISLAPGLGSLANGHVSHYNVLPNLPSVDEAGLTRDESPGAGAISPYHNYTFFVQSLLRPGDEILLNYGVRWFQERQAKLSTHSTPPPPTTTTTTGTTTSTAPTETNRYDQQQSQYQQQATSSKPRRSKDWLTQHALCLDNLRPGPSTIPHAGRGAFATRSLSIGSIIAPIPVLPILRHSLEIARVRSKQQQQQQGVDKKNANAKEKVGEEEELVQLQQLLLNYCYGNANSSLLLYPIAPTVNFINHAGTSESNVKLQWSPSLSPPQIFHRNAKYLSLTIPQLLEQNYSGLLLELVATRDIRRGEEILLDYGDDWQKAWGRHTSTWRPLDQFYTPSYVMDDVVRKLRTVAEQRHHHPYPNNVFTSCYYRYSDHKHQAEGQFLLHQQQKEKPNHHPSSPQVTTFRWNATKDILLDMRFLRPCEVLAREHPNGGDVSVYTVRIRNRFGLSAQERIPSHMLHIVTHVPRYAVRFSDKLYTTDQHLEQAFRHEIGLPSSMIPAQWNDLVQN